MWKFFCIVVCAIAGVVWVAQTPINVHGGKPEGIRVQAHLAGWLVYDNVLPEAEANRMALWLGLGILGAGLAVGIGVGVLLVVIASTAFRRGWLPSWLVLPEWIPVSLLAAMLGFVVGAAGLTNSTSNPDGTQTVTVYRYGYQIYQVTGPRGTFEWVHSAFLFGLGGLMALISGLIAFLLWRFFGAPSMSEKPRNDLQKT
jgi:hypothetical protein